MSLTNIENGDEQARYDEEQAGDVGHKKIYNWPLIIEREYKTRIQLRSFKIITLVLILIVVIGATFPTVLTILNSKSQTYITIINSAGPVAGLNDQALRKYIDSNLNAAYNTAATTDKSTGTTPPYAVSLASTEANVTSHQQVRAQKIAILLTISRTSTKELAFDIYTNQSLSQNNNLIQLQTLTAQLNIQDKLSALGLSQAQTVATLAQPNITTESTLSEKNGRTSAENDAASIISLFGIVLLLLFIQQYSGMVAAGVAEEKGSRIMEILVNATTPFQLLLGKIIGVGLVGITQLGLVSLVGGAAILAQGPLKTALLGTSSSSFNLDITSISLGMLGLLVLFFVLGFLLYAALYAAAGALVSRQEEVSSSITPLTFLVMTSYLLSFYVALNPNADWVIPVSYIPFLTPMMILAREGVAPLAWWEIASSSLIMVVSILICTWFAARIYRVGILMYGQKPGFGAFFKYMRSRPKGAA